MIITHRSGDPEDLIENNTNVLVHVQSVSGVQMVEKAFVTEDHLIEIAKSDHILKKNEDYDAIKIPRLTHIFCLIHICDISKLKYVLFFRVFILIVLIDLRKKSLKRPDVVWVKRATHLRPKTAIILFPNVETASAILQKYFNNQTIQRRAFIINL